MNSRFRGYGGEQVSARDSRGMPSVNICTVEMVGARLAEAAEVIQRLPPVRVPGYFNTWPPMIAGFADRVGQQAEPMRLPPPSPASISRMEEALAWLRWLKPEHAKLIWARAEGDALEADLLAFRHRARHRASTLAVRALPDRVPAHWTEGASEAFASLCERFSRRALTARLAGRDRR